MAGITAERDWWEDEEARFAESGLLFTLDRSELENTGTVVFRGFLRRGHLRCSALVAYPATYLDGDHPVVVAAGLPITRHKVPDGTLCLDHPVAGQLKPMTGAEAALRAEELWRLSAEDPEGLREAEADAPDPQIDFYEYEPGSGILMIDVDVQGHQEGYLRLGLTGTEPVRGGVAGFGAGDELPLRSENHSYVGPLTALALWRRIEAPPPGRNAAGLVAWAAANHASLVAQARALAGAQGNTAPAIVAFVFPDEGPGYREYHDAWLGMAIQSSGQVKLVRFYTVQRREHWIRQPQLRTLGQRSAAFIGVGALGSQIAGLLARAGLSKALLLDHDLVTPANRVRHELDLGDIGDSKVLALSRRLIRINPYLTVDPQRCRFGWLGQQRELTVAVQNCDLIINATAHIPTGYHISTIADQARTPALHVAVGSGAWGARILLQRHGESGCLECLARHQVGGAEIPDLPEDPDHPEVLDQGCGQPSFTGPGFELTAAAAAAARLAVQTLVAGYGYPEAEYDLATLTLRGQPEVHYMRLAPHPRCQSCTSPQR